MRVVTIVGARPQFVKAAPLSRALRAEHEEILVHTGQHYDDNMSDVFFRELGVPPPDRFLGAGGGSHATQTAAMLTGIEAVLVETRPDVVVVLGDTNSTLAGALAAVKEHIPVAHVEAGLRSFNRRMPEEVNRVATDHLSSLLFAPSAQSAAWLAAEGILKGVHVVGDIMRDAVDMFAPRASRRLLDTLGVLPRRYVLATIHRAENADDASRLRAIFGGLGACTLPVVVPLHPRTKARLSTFGFAAPANALVTEPVGYLDMLALERDAACIVTDSGGVQKEAYYLGVPCVTVRDETEWVETVSTGWNSLIRADATDIGAALAQACAPEARTRPRPELYGDGHAAVRIVAALPNLGSAHFR